MHWTCRSFFIFMDEIPKAGWGETARLLFDYRTRYRVEGDSMAPTLMPGVQVSVDERAEVLVGDIVVVRHPFKKNITMVKRVRELDEKGRYFLISDNLEGSTDSRSFGAVPKSHIVGKVTTRLI